MGTSDSWESTTTPTVTADAPPDSSGRSRRTGAVIAAGVAVAGAGLALTSRLRGRKAASKPSARRATSSRRSKKH